MTTSARIIILRLALSCATSLVGCGDDGPSGEPDASSGSGGMSGSSGTGGMGGSGGMVLDPPSSIDLESCSHILLAEVTTGASCLACCADAGFDNASFPYGEACVCGRRKPHETEICADRSDSEESCDACCNDASYRYGSLRDGPCECSIPEDPEVCADSNESEDSCTTCCLNHGSLGHSNDGNACICSG